MKGALAEMKYRIKPNADYAVFPLTVPESKTFAENLKKLDSSGLIDGTQLTSLLNADGSVALLEEGGHLSVYVRNDNKDIEIARVIPLVRTEDEILAQISKGKVREIV